MYRLIFILTCLALGASQSVQAQLLLGLEGGLSFNSLSYTGYYYYDFGENSTTTKAVTTPVFGLRAELGLQSGVRIVSGLRYAQLGGVYSYEGIYSTTGMSSIPGEFQVEYDYLEIPVGAKIFLSESPWSFYIGLNAVAAVNIRAESIGPPNIEEPVVDYSEYASDVVPFVDMLAGLDIPVSSTVRLFFEGRYSQSVTGIDKEGPESTIARSYILVLGAVVRVFNFADEDPSHTREAAGY